MLTLLFVLNAAVIPAADIPELTAPEVNISIQPSYLDSYQLLKRKTPETYTCSAWVEQAGAKPRRAYITADLVVSPGGSEKVSRRVGDYALDFAVTMKDNRAHAEVTVKRGDQVLTRQSSTVYLNKPQTAFLPAN
jgi:hypothetical protein